MPELTDERIAEIERWAAHLEHSPLHADIAAMASELTAAREQLRRVELYESFCGRACYELDKIKEHFDDGWIPKGGSIWRIDEIGKHARLIREALDALPLPHESLTTQAEQEGASDI